QHDDVLDFVQAHYQLTARSDTAFWKDYANLPRSKALEAMIKAFHNDPQALTEEARFRVLTGRRYGMFHGWSYMALLMGSGLRPCRSSAWV
ncbi:MAG: hypothetical protein EBT99_16670, partial [Betaproteobacteria bacterium]|nr:hypothetical protein [Betaproteobacteria bacterium]